MSSSSKIAVFGTFARLIELLVQARKECSQSADLTGVLLSGNTIAVTLLREDLVLDIQRAIGAGSRGVPYIVLWSR